MLLAALWCAAKVYASGAGLPIDSICACTEIVPEANHELANSRPTAFKTRRHGRNAMRWHWRSSAFALASFATLACTLAALFKFVDGPSRRARNFLVSTIIVTLIIMGVLMLLVSSTCGGSRQQHHGNSGRVHQPLDLNITGPVTVRQRQNTGATSVC